MITDTATLETFCARAEQAPYVTVDTEFLRESTYWPILCLVQVAMGGDLMDGEDDADLSAVIDPIENPDMDLSPLYRLFANENVLKVFHAARQDLEIFHHQSGALPHPVFDTQVAAMVCGFGDSVGYENLLTRLTGATVDKGTRFTDWSIRPLNKRQIDYALADVVYLRPAYEKLCKMLADQGREDWIGEEMSGLLDEKIYLVDPMETYLRIKSRNAKPRTLAVLRELAAWRELEARRRDQPRNRILRDEAMLEIAHHTPDSVAKLERTRGLGKRMAEGQAGQDILKAVKRGMDIPGDQCPKPRTKPDLPNGIGPTMDLLKVLLKMKCEEFNVAQKLIASSEDVEMIAAFGEKADVSAMRSWRREVFGEDALRIRSGECALGIEGRRVVLKKT
ncbi:MAG: ribonuclease D [Rhodospirillales bacterium]|nr:ribonuclease D [Rhodospirillales bacterium]MBT4039051.1 ribonuclease D [Rhodospirillales bacterium]MBT4625359.1 ribonuclease D [Rhodospirillales bacterium]MBT5351829.1 ribonuclease D [Rhodospirillales bacterium]MBT5520914.1 ribonuclease D [Rhodospirillales bacterium]